MIGKLIVILIIILIGVFIITHTNLLYHPQSTSVNSREPNLVNTTRSTINESIITYQFSIVSNSSTNYTFPLKLNHPSNITIKVSGKGFNLTIINNSTNIYSGLIEGYFTKSFIANGSVDVIFSSRSGIDANVTVIETYNS
ncbi:MAG: hypothetical protein QXH75_02950 [Sulfolobaceae archaeon]